MQALPPAADLAAARARVAALEAVAAAEAEAERVRAAADRAADADDDEAVRRAVKRTAHASNVAMLEASIEAVDAAELVLAAFHRAEASVKDRPGSSAGRPFPAMLPQAVSACRALAARRRFIADTLTAERAALAALDGP